MQSTILSDPRYSGILSAATPSGQSPLEELEIQLDVEAEQETLTDGLVMVEPSSDLPQVTSGPLKFIQASVQEASKGVTERTDAEYRRLMAQCQAFLVQQNLVHSSENFFSPTPVADAPLFITAWIMSACDSMALGGGLKPADEVRDSYGHAQKMRVAMTYAFGRIHGLGSVHWQEDKPGSGHFVGNPSISQQVSNYMYSLRRRKIQGGEVACSARAITSDILYRLYHHNHRSENWTIRPYAAGMTRRADSQDCPWAGGRMRRLLHAVYTLAYICLLRIDEVLKIQSHDIIVEERPDLPVRLIVNLPFRKTHQHGDVKPFYLYLLPKSEAHLCPVRAYAEWIKCSHITTGYLFRRIASGDRVADENKPLGSEVFLEMFHNNLLDISIDPYPYGTHSFRRGGCQYLHLERRWPLRRICEWGGWSTKFTSLTIVKYLISFNDDPTEPREHFFDPLRPPTVKCPQCGRSCPCA